MYTVRGLDICTPEQPSKTCFNPCSNQIPQHHDKYSVPVPRDILTSPTDTINTATIIHQYRTAVLPMTIPNSHTDSHSQTKFQTKFQTQSNSHLPPKHQQKQHQTTYKTYLKHTRYPHNHPELRPEERSPCGPENSTYPVHPKPSPTGHPSVESVPMYMCTSSSNHYIHPVSGSWSRGQLPPARAVPCLFLH
jgi:hypothetical protein